MKISRRETVMGVVTLFIVLFGITYSMGGTKFDEYRQMGRDNERLQHQIKLNKKILSEQEKWTDRLKELQSKLPVYDQRVSVTGEILKDIKGLADSNHLDLTKSRSDNEEKIGNLYELSVTCDWEGELDALIHFLYDMHEKGIRFDIEQITVRPDAKREGILRGDMNIACAFRRTEAAQETDE